MTKHYTDSGTLLIRNSDIKDNKFEFSDNPIYLDNEFAEQNKTRQHQIGDVVTVHTGDVGTSAVITEKEANSIGFATIITRPNRNVIIPEYLSTFLNTEKHKKWAIAISTGDGRTNYNLGDYYKLEIPVPNIKEQDKISNFILKLDNLITLHQRKFYKIFYSWEQRKLEQISEIVGGGTPSTIIPEYWDGDINWYTPAEIGDQINVKSSQRKITQLGLEKCSAKKLPVGTVLFTSRAGIGNSAILKESGCTNQGFQSIIPKKNLLDTYFIFSMTDEIKKYAEIIGAGSTFVEVSGKQMKNMNILIPKIKEQEKIGQLFENLDNLITLHQQYIF